MTPPKVCRFCDIVVGKYFYGEIDEPFASNDEFFALASIGAIVEGWSLVIPKQHQISMRSVYSISTFSDFLRSIIPNLLDKFGPLIAFEHGANKENSITACGTDHAHLHIVPMNVSLLPELQRSNMQWIQCYSSEIASNAKNREYLFYVEIGLEKTWHDPKGYLHVLERPHSQFFRSLIAERHGTPEISNYRQFPLLSTAKKTREILSSSFL